MLTFKTYGCQSTTQVLATYFGKRLQNVKGYARIPKDAEYTTCISEYISPSFLLQSPWT
jgi:hypothetical protein